MSWEVHLYVGDESVSDWNYTGNTDPMLNMAAAAIGAGTGPWWSDLDGCSASAGAGYLGRLIGWMVENPDRCRELNPPNGWGDYASLLAVLEEMHAAGRSTVEGRWRVYG